MYPSITLSMIALAVSSYISCCVLESSYTQSYVKSFHALLLSSCPGFFSVAIAFSRSMNTI